MIQQKTYTSGTLTLEITEGEPDLTMRWLGKSAERDPGKFIAPILDELLSSSAPEKRIVLDFTDLAYMNSSTITPVIRFLEQVKRGTRSASVTYRKVVKWQDLSFAALAMFKTRDERIQIRGV